MRPYSSNLSIFTLPHSVAERKNAMQMPLLCGDFGGERVNGGRNKESAFTGKRILTENVGPRTCLPVFHKLSTAIRGIPASMVKNTLRVLRQRQLVCTSFWSGLRGSNSLPGIPRIAFRNSQEPCLTSDPIALRAWVSVSSSFRLTKKSGHPSRMS